MIYQHPTKKDENILRYSLIALPEKLLKSKKFAHRCFVFNEQLKSIQHQKTN